MAEQELKDIIAGIFRVRLTAEEVGVRIGVSLDVARAALVEMEQEGTATHTAWQFKPRGDAVNDEVSEIWHLAE
jgi:hypothetical protein